MYDKWYNIIFIFFQDLSEPKISPGALFGQIGLQSIPKVTAGMRLSYAYTLFFFFQITPVIQYKVSPKVHKYNILTNSNNTLWEF